jgi:hypothetical protein
VGRLVNRSEVLALLGISNWTLRQLIQQGCLVPVYPTASRAVARFPLDQVHKLMEESAARATTGPRA